MHKKRKSSSLVRKGNPERIIPYDGFLFVEKKTKIPGLYKINVELDDDKRTVVYESDPYDRLVMSQIIRNDRLKDEIIDVIVRTTKKTLKGNRLKNPDPIREIKDEDAEVEKIDFGPFGMPESKLKAFELGRMYGLRRGLELCKLFSVKKFFQRRDLKRSIDAQMDYWFRSFDQQIEAAKRGVQGATIPQQSRAGSSSQSKK